MQKITFEVCAGSYQDCLAAEKGGADRVELNSALSVGADTITYRFMRAKKETSLKIVCMVRPRAGGFCYDETEARLMLEEAELFLEHGADGIAFDF
ncbi:MAG: copper homeostasis protein CutC [Clostridia bacterium]